MRSLLFETSIVFFQTGEHHYLSKNYPYNCNNYISKLLSSSIEQKTASACYQLVRVDKYMPNMYLISFADQSNSCTLKKGGKKCIMITYTFWCKPLFLRCIMRSNASSNASRFFFKMHYASKCVFFYANRLIFWRCIMHFLVYCVLHFLVPMGLGAFFETTN